eukprot:2501574-Ditylum_brightwellii.AAC.1
MTPRTAGVIALCPTGNVQGGYFFFSPSSAGRRINRNRWTILPMPEDTIQRIHQLTCQDPLGIVIKDYTGTENMHDPVLEQIENDDENDDSTYVPDEEDSKKDDDASIPSIDSVQEAPICHDIDNFEPLITTTDTTDNTHVEDDKNNVTVGVNTQEEEDDDNAFTVGVTIQNEEDESSSSEEEASEEEAAPMAGVQQDEKEEVMMEDETLQAKINKREVQVNVLPPTNKSNNSQSIEDQIAHIEKETDQSYGTRIRGGLRLRKLRNIIPNKFQ